MDCFDICFSQVSAKVFLCLNGIQLCVYRGVSEVAAVDCGIVINPYAAANMGEGAIVDEI